MSAFASGMGCRAMADEMCEMLDNGEATDRELLRDQIREVCWELQKSLKREERFGRIAYGDKWEQGDAGMLHEYIRDVIYPAKQEALEVWGDDPQNEEDAT